MVRVTLAECIGLLASSSLRFLEIAQMSIITESDPVLRSSFHYDTELATLREMFHVCFRTIIVWNSVVLLCESVRLVNKRAVISILANLVGPIDHFSTNRTFLWRWSVIQSMWNMPSSAITSACCATSLVTSKVWQSLLFHNIFEFISHHITYKLWNYPLLLNSMVLADWR